MTKIEQIHQLIDQRIRQKTADGSIAKTDVADALDAIADALYVNANQSVTISSGDSFTIPNGTKRVYIDYSQMQPRLTLTLPDEPQDGDDLVLYFGGQLPEGEKVIANYNLFIEPNKSKNPAQRLAKAFQDTALPHTVTLDSNDYYLGEVILSSMDGDSVYTNERNTTPSTSVEVIVGGFAKPKPGRTTWAYTDQLGYVSEGSLPQYYSNPFSAANGMSMNAYLQFLADQFRTFATTPTTDNVGLGFDPSEIYTEITPDSLKIGIAKSAYAQITDIPADMVIVPQMAAQTFQGQGDHIGGKKIQFSYRGENSTWF
jgi:hypothetical protein